jgi:hypothetical protein
MKKKTKKKKGKNQNKIKKQRDNLARVDMQMAHARTIYNPRSSALQRYGR